MNKDNIESKEYIKVDKIEDKGEKSKTYCFTEPKNMLEYLMVFLQVNEIIEYSDSKKQQCVI